MPKKVYGFWGSILLNSLNIRKPSPCPSGTFFRADYITTTKNRSDFVAESGVRLLPTLKPILERQGWWKGRFALFRRSASSGERADSVQMPTPPFPPPTISGQSAFKGAFQGCIGRGRGLRLETAQSALAVILKLVTWWSDQRHLDCFGVLLIFSSRVGLLPFLWGQFSELWRLMSRLQSGHHVVKSFHLMGVSVSTGQLTGYGSEYYLQPLAKN